MLTTCKGPAFPILDKWDAWALENHRVDMRKAIWAIYDLLEGRYFPPESQRIVDTFLSERTKSPDLQVVKNEIRKSTESLPPGCVKCSNRDMKPNCPLNCEFNELEIF
jgi:hypothetical protein